nr:immunoglobulin-like domain-containing protein [uncultured Lachnoclostridium sp.]
MKRLISLLVVGIFTPILLSGCGTKILTPDSRTTEPDSNALYQPSITEVGEVEGTDHDVKDSHPMVMINGELYYDTGKESDIGARCGVMDGKILSTVDGSDIPTEDNQSNFGSGYEYQYVGDGGIDIVIDQKWIRFEKESKKNTESMNNSEMDAWGVQLTASNITPTGLTLECNQSGGQPSGELSTGSRFWLEVKTEDQWTPVETLKLEYVVAWTLEGWIITKNGSTEWKVNWERLYGELPSGSYRIGKEVMDFRATGDYDTNDYYAYFEIVD